MGRRAAVTPGRGLRQGLRQMCMGSRPARSSALAPGLPATAMPDWIELLQWPAMLATVLAAWLVASSHDGRRHAGFWVFLLSNLLWVVWGWHTGATALVVLQFSLAVMNIRGARKTGTG